MEREVRYCTTRDGVRIAYATTGSGYPLLRGLGWMSHLEFEGRTPLWRATNDALSDRFEFTRYDGRGTGLSDRNIEEFSLETYVADLEAVVDAAGLERFALLGISQGGAASIAYCLRHPERVSHLVLYGAFARPFFEREIVESLTGLVRLGWDTPAVRQMFTTAFIPDGGLEEMRWFNEFQRETISAEAAARVLQTNLELDVSGSARSLSTPTLVIHRRGDGVVPFDQGRELASLIPRARFLPLDGKNHLFLQGEEELSNFVAAIDEFIGANDVAAKQTERPVGPSLSFRTVLFTDLAGHTAMMSRLGDERGRAVLREHERITRDVLKAHGGTEVKTMGDGFMASFPSVTRGVECAIALQRAFAAREGEPLLVRVGLDAGEPIEEEGDLFGATVILASRIAAKAEGGEILVADTVRGLCSGKGFLFADRGEFVAKGFEDPVRVYEVRWRE